MGWLGRFVGIALALVVFVVVAVWLASESGEVLVLRTYDANGGAHDTRIWVVDDGGAVWVRAGRPESGWAQRLLANADVQMTRGGSTIAARAVAVDDDATRVRIDRLMAEKYGLADRFIGVVARGARPLPIRLEPR